MAEMISAEQVKHVARLARLALPEDRLATLAGQLESILEYVDKIKGVDVAGVEPMAHALPISQRLPRGRGRAQPARWKKCWPTRPTPTRLSSRCPRSSAGTRTPPADAPGGRDTRSAARTGRRDPPVRRLLIPLWPASPYSPTAMLSYDTLLAARDAIRAKDISSAELTPQALARIEQLDPSILAFNSTYRRPRPGAGQGRRRRAASPARWPACRSPSRTTSAPASAPPPARRRCWRTSAPLTTPPSCRSWRPPAR